MSAGDIEVRIQVHNTPQSRMRSIISKEHKIHFEYVFFGDDMLHSMVLDVKGKRNVYFYEKGLVRSVRVVLGTNILNGCLDVNYYSLYKVVRYSKLNKGVSKTGREE
jgi:hypothetical protein